VATRDELLELRKLTVARVEKLRRLGDHSAEAPDIRANAEAILSLIEDRLESKR
jgi:hypothetical protein